MNVLFICPNTDPYGANRSMIYLIKDLENRYNIKSKVILPFKGKVTELFEQEKIEYQCCLFGNWLRKPKKSWQDTIRKIVNIVNYRRIYHKVKTESFDIVHSNSSTTELGQYLADKLNIPHVWHIREFGEEDYGLQYYYPMEKVRRQYERADIVVAISDAVLRKYKKLAPSANLIRIYNGVAVNSGVKKYGDEKKVRFCIVGLVAPAKNQLDAVKACKILKDEGYTEFTLDILGGDDNPYGEEIHKYIKENELRDIVRCNGYCDHISESLLSMDIGIITSLNEAFGRVTVEYMMAGLAVIASDTGSNQELVKDGKNGYIYTLHNSADLAEKMKGFLQDRKQIETMGIYAKEYAQDNFKMEYNTDQIYDLYNGMKGC